MFGNFVPKKLLVKKKMFLSKIEIIKLWEVYFFTYIFQHINTLYYIPFLVSKDFSKLLLGSNLNIKRLIQILNSVAFIDEASF